MLLGRRSPLPPRIVDMSEAERLVADLTAIRLPDVFNPYSDTCPLHDLPGAPALRRRNLVRVLERAEMAVGGALWVGLELGYGGGRRTGLPMTAEKNLVQQEARWGLRELHACTRSGPKAEITSTAVWASLEMVQVPVFLWNIFPLHSHPPARQLANRRHSPAEAQIGFEFLERIVDLLEPQLIIGMGQDAQKAMKRRDLDHASVRHPAYGGAADFARDIRSAHERLAPA